MGDRLRPLWDFDDFDASEARFRAQLEEETTDAGRAEVLTQLARVEGLRDEFERCDELLDEAEALGGVTARLLLERGRRERSSGRDGAGLAEFLQAFELAQASGEDVLAVDAVHMLALVDDAEGWTARGIEIAGASEDPASGTGSGRCTTTSAGRASRPAITQAPRGFRAGARCARARRSARVGAPARARRG